MDKSKGKKGANLRFNSTMFFQIGLIVSIALVTIIINWTSSITVDEAKYNIEDDMEEVWMSDFVIIQPKPEVKIKPKKVVKKVVNPDKIIITDKEVIDSPVEIDTDPEPEVVNKPVVAVEKPKPKEEDNKIHSLIHVERVPVFPGCESLTSNTQRRDCMSDEIGKLINRKFDSGIAEDIGLSGNQRIYVSFVINKKGELDQLQVRAPHPRLEREARRVVGMIPKMMPGLQNNREVDVLFTLPIIFNVVN